MASRVTFREPTLADVLHVARHMRPGDAAECAALGFASPLEALTRSIGASEASNVALFDDEPACIFGVAALHQTALGSSRTHGVAWVLTSTAVDRHRREFLRWSPVMVEGMLSRYETLINVVDDRYHAALRWARWLGFSVSEPVTLPSGVPFRRITLKRDAWVQRQR